MKLIGNVTNGQYFADIVNNLKADQISEVWVAVAYATSKTEIFDFCFDNKIPVKFFGRYDKSIPVSSAILKTFVDRSSDRYRAYLINEYYHPKVYWFKGYGAYIGSANIGNKAWFDNIELGLFLTEDELREQFLDVQLESFFDFLLQPKVSTMLNADIYKQIAKQEKNFSLDKKEFDKNVGDEVNLLPRFVPEQKASQQVTDKHRENFLREWNETLEVIRGIQKLVVLDKYRPDWIPSTTPAGVQVDQFLHAFYYTKTRSTEGPRRYLYPEFYEENKTNPTGAIERELAWWKSTTTGPNNEDDFIKRRAPRLKDLFSKPALVDMTEAQFVEACELLHAFENVARYFPPEKLGILPGENSDLTVRTPRAAKKIFSERSKNGKRVNDLLFHILYSGPQEEIVHRLYSATNDPDFQIPRFGRSCIGEIVGWALPDAYPPRNDRTNKALRGLGYPVTIWNPGKGDDQ